MLLKKGAYLAPQTLQSCVKCLPPRNTRGRSLFLNVHPNERSRAFVLRAQAEERMNLRKKMTFFTLAGPPPLNPLTEVRCFYVKLGCWWKYGLCRSTERKPAGQPAGARRGEGARGFGAVGLQVAKPRETAVHTLHRPWGWWESDSWVPACLKLICSGDLGFLSWPPGKRVCGFRGQVTIVMPFWVLVESPTQTLRDLISWGERRNTVLCFWASSSSAFGSPGLLPWWNVLTSRAPKRPLSLGSGNASLQVLCFLFVRLSSPTL